MTEYETITLEQSGPIARITLNRPDAANGMNHTMTRELDDAAKRCDTDATKVVLLTGSGRFFCAGGDLKSFANAPNRGQHIKGVADDLHRAISTFARMDAVARQRLASGMRRMADEEDAALSAFLAFPAAM